MRTTGFKLPQVAVPKAKGLTQAGLAEVIRDAVKRMTGDQVFESAYEVKLSCNPAEQTYWAVALDTLKNKDEFSRLKFDMKPDSKVPSGQVAVR